MKKSWDKFYKTHGRFYLQTHPFFERVTNRFKTYNVRTVLDLGCGSGRHCVALAEHGFQVEGIDFSPSAVELAKSWLHQKALHAKVVIGDFHNHIAGTYDATLDAVISINSLHYSNEEEFKKVIREVNRVLKEGGLFWLVVPSKETDLKDAVEQKVFYNEDKLKELISSTFRILEFSKDENNSYSILAQEK